MIIILKNIFTQAKIIKTANYNIRQVKRVKKNIIIFGMSKASKLKIQEHPRLVT